MKFWQEWISKNGLPGIFVQINIHESSTKLPIKYITQLSTHSGSKLKLSASRYAVKKSF